MIQLPCPNCGLRDENEFIFGGEANVVRPGLDCDDAIWEAYLFHRANSKGDHAERWLHEQGCRTWFNLVRDTVSHRIIAVYPMGELRP